MYTDMRVMSWKRVAMSLQALVAHALLFSFVLLFLLKLDHSLRCRWWVIFAPLWLFHAVVARGRFSLPAPALPHDRHWAPYHAIMATPLFVSFELLLCLYLDRTFVMDLKILFVPILAFEIAVLVDNIRMCRALMPGDDESLTDDAIWATLPHFWVAISMVFCIAATAFTLLKLCGDVMGLTWWDLFINYGIAECFAFLVCTKWDNPAIHGRSYVREAEPSSVAIRYIDWDRQLIVSSEEDQNFRMCCSLQDIGGHIIKIPIVLFQILLIMRLEGTPHIAQQMPLPVVFTPLLLVQGAGLLFATYRLIEKIVFMLQTEAASCSSNYFLISSKIRDCFGFLHHGSRLLGWWSIDEASQQERARLFCSGSSGFLLHRQSLSLSLRMVVTAYSITVPEAPLICYNTFSPDVVKKLPKSDLVEEIWRLQAALREQTEVTKSSQQEYERLQNEKILCRICFEDQINVVMLPCRHHALCRSCCNKCKKCPICRVSIEGRLPVAVHEV